MLAITKWNHDNTEISYLGKYFTHWIHDLKTRIINSSRFGFQRLENRRKLLNTIF